MIRRRAFAITTSVLLALSGGAGIALAVRNMPASADTVVQVAEQAGAFKTLLAAAQAAGLVEALNGPGPITVFAPSDEAFAKLGNSTINDLLRPENKAKLAGILAYHVVPGRVSAAEAIKLSAAPTLNGQRLALSVKDGQLRIDEARVVKTDIDASNGVIHVIDRVLLPTERDIVQQAKRGHFNTLLAAAKAAGLVETLSGPGPLTVFVPTDEAFAKLPAGTVESLLKPENKARLAAILTYHVVPGRVFADGALAAGSAATVQGETVRVALKDGRLMVNDSTIIKPDVDASNGVIHVIDRVLLPNAAASDGAAGSENSKRSMMASGAAATPQRLIEAAIERGVPLFNRGDQDACASVYELTTLALLARDDVPSEVKTALRTAAEKADAAASASDKAWALREGLDRALGKMGG